MKMRALLVVAALLPASQAVAGSCELNFKVENGEYSSRTTIADLSVDSALAQMIFISIGNGGQYAGESKTTTSGTLLFDQPGTARFATFRTTITAVLKEGGTELGMRFRPSAGTGLTDAAIKTQMCQMLGRVNAGPEGQSIARQIRQTQGTVDSRIAAQAKTAQGTGDGKRGDNDTNAVGTSAPMSMGEQARQQLAHAGENGYLIHAFGQKPSRSVVLVDLNSVEQTLSLEQLNEKLKSDGALAAREAKAAAPMNITLFEVNESKDQPDKTEYRLKFDCKRQRMRSVETFVSWRDGTSQTLPGQAEWQGIPKDTATTWMQRARAFACDPASRSGGQTVALKTAVNLLSVADIAWGRFWTDGTRPPRTSNMTAAERAAGLQKMQRILAQTQKASDEVDGAVENIDREMVDFYARQKKITRVITRRTQTPNMVLETWVGASQASMLGSWGPPHQQFNENGATMATYYRALQFQTIRGDGAVMGTRKLRCSVRFVVESGTITDYFTEGDRDECTKDFPRGPITPQ